MKYEFPIMTKGRGQAIIQYMVVVGIVTVAVMSMGTGMRRTMQAGYKNISDQIGGQDTFPPDPKKGFVDKAVSNMKDRSTTTREEKNGIIILDRQNSSGTANGLGEDGYGTMTVSHYGTPPE